MDSYADPADLDSGDWVETVPASAARSLKLATVLVAQAAGRNPYTDTPTSIDAAVLRDATCAQAAYWIRSGVDIDDLAASLVKRSEILTGVVEYDTTAQAKARADATYGLCDEARAVLQIGGLLAEPMPLFDECGALPSWGLDGPRAYQWPPLAEWPFV